ncbi:MAG TPA: hypothetical protein VEH31_42260, partial [Streptosporangiaceae bacterium]|nr:hypothetical protein [Streptosporangiaceae bacterium]
MAARPAQGGRLLTARTAWLAAAVPDVPLALPVAVLVGWSLIGARRQRRGHLHPRPRHTGDRPGTGNRTGMTTEGVTGPAEATGTAPPRFGVRSMSATLRRVLLRRPSVTGDFAAAAWRAPDAGLLARQHEAFGQLLTDLGCEVEVAPAADGLVDATYVRDPGLVTGAGAVLFQMAKPARVAEPALLGAALSAAGVP